MERTLILDCNNKIGQTVKICGWVQVSRDHGKILFLDVLDRTGLIQIVVPPGVKLIHPPGVQDVVCIEGKVNKRPENLINQQAVSSANKNIPTGEIEIAADEIEILSKAQELPFDMGGPELHLELPTLLDWRSLTLRHPKIKAIFKVQAAILEGFRKAAADLDCTAIVGTTISVQSRSVAAF